MKRLALSILLVLLAVWLVQAETFEQYLALRPNSTATRPGDRVIVTQGGVIKQAPLTAGTVGADPIGAASAVGAVFSGYTSIRRPTLAANAFTGPQTVPDIIAGGPMIDVRKYSGDLQQALNHAVSGSTIIIPQGTYTGSFNIGAAQNIRILGIGRPTITSSTPTVFTFDQDANNIWFEGINIQSTSSAAGGVLGLVTGIGVNVKNIHFNRVTFSAFSCETNAIKIDVGSGSLDGLIVSNCDFSNIGRMAIEIINHTFDGMSRYKNILVSNNKFYNLGTASIYGQAVSLSGLGNNAVIANNNIEAATDIAIENVGASNVTIAGNTIHDLATNCISISVGWANATYYPNNVNIVDNVMQNLSGGYFQPTRIISGSISGNVISNSSHKISMQSLNGVAITGNVFNVSQQIYMSSLTGCSISGNTFHSTTGTAGYYPYMVNCVGNSIGANNWISENIFALDIAGASTGNNITGGLFDNSASTLNAQTIRIEGTSTNNTVTGAKVNKGTGGSYYGESGTSGNSFLLMDTGSIRLTSGGITFGPASAGLATTSSSDVELIDGAGNTTLRGVRATGWADSQNAGFMQIGKTNDKAFITGASGSVLNRLNLSAATTQVGGTGYATIPAPIGNNLYEAFDPLNNLKFAVGYYGFLYNPVGASVASAATITPLAPIVHVTGASTINTIVLPYTGFTGCLRIIPDGAFTTGTSGNIALASTAVVSKVLEFCYDGTKWYPSY